MLKHTIRFALTGAAAGLTNGFFGGGGGSVLVPLLHHSCRLEQEKAFPAEITGAGAQGLGSSLSQARGTVILMTFFWAEKKMFQ